MHEGGKIEVLSRMPVNDRDDLSMAYTPGVARVCTAIQQQPALAHELTIKKNTVAIVTDGTAVLGLGDIGPGGALPVRSEEHTSELQSLMRISYAVFCLKKKKNP